MLIPRTLTLLCGLLLLTTGSAHAHFLWIVPKSHEKTPVVHVYFSESASPDDPNLLDRVLKAEAFVFGGRRGTDPQPLKLTKEGDALRADLTAEQQNSPVLLKHTYGVISRGGESFLLKYFAKGYPQELPGSWRAVKDAELLPLEIVPAAGATGLELTVLWQGKSQSGVVVTIEGPGIEKKLEGATNEAGNFSAQLAQAGLYSIRAKFVENASGEFEGTGYTQIRHFATLALRYVPSKLSPAVSGWPDLSKGVTSFGGAILGDSLYVYGGHYGTAHEYYQEEQSGDFYRLNLRDSGKWESLPGGPKLTGLAMVSDGRRLYRVGGFTAKNSQGAKEDLWSQSDFSRFDPQMNQWEQLVPLPEGRSSHDAAIVGNTLYVVGGWEMRGSEKTRWHDTAWSVDLSAAMLQWKPVVSPPFHRRAIALAAWSDKLYCLGGMQEQGGPTTAVAVFDPTRNEWSAGPALIGSDMDGFGSSAFACHGRLFATTMSGSVQELNARGDRWEFVGQLAQPRFFHRLLPWSDEKLVIVGGASMVRGKILSLEMLPVRREQAAAN